MEVTTAFSLLSYILLSSAETIVFDVLTNNTNDIVVAAQQSTRQLNNAQNGITLKVYSHGISQVQNSLAIYGNDLLSRNASIVFDVTGTKKVSKYVGSILKIPVFGIWNHACMHCERDLHSHINHNYISMLPSKAYTAQLITNLLSKLQWNPVGIIYQSHREADLFVLLRAFSGKILDQSVVAVNCKRNGSIETYSHKNLKKLVDTKPSAIVIIYDEHDLQYLIDFMKSDAVGLQAVHMNYIIFDPIESYTLKAENVYTIVSLVVDIQNNAEMLSLTTAVNSASHSGKLINPVVRVKSPEGNNKNHSSNVPIIVGLQASAAEHVLLYDAIKSAGIVIEELVQKNIWNYTYGNTLANHHKRTSNGLQFFRELEIFKHSGLTGNIEFSNDSYRKNMPFQILNLQENTFKKIGRISEDGTISLTTQPKTNFKLDSQFQINGHLKIVTILEEPYTMKRTLGNGTTVYYGFLVDIVDELTKVANFTYSLYEVADNGYGYIENGVWKGMVGDVLYKKADMAMAPLTITSARQGVVQFTTPYLEVPIVFVRKKEEAAVFNLMLFMEPFTSHVWLLILGGCIVVGIVLYSVDYFSPFGWRQTGESTTGEPGTEFDISNSIWFSMASILLQGADNTPRSFSGRILVGMFWFYVLILTSSYTANLAAYFTSTKANDELTDLETLLKSGHSFTIIETYALEQYLKNSDYKVYKRVHERMVLQNTLTKGMGESLKLIRADPNMYYLEEKPFVQWVANKKPCDLKLVDATIQESGFGMPVSLNSPYAGAISHGISKIQESGFIAARRKYYWGTINACKNLDATQGITGDGRLEPLQMLGVYAFLVGGIVISVITMFVEIWWKKKVEERAAHVKAKFRQSFRNAIAQKRGTSTRVQKIAIQSRDPASTLRIAVQDLMKEKGEKSM